MAEFFKSLKEYMSQVYFIIIFTVLTFYIHNGYFDTLPSKGAVLFWATLFYVVTMTISYIALFISKKEQKHDILKQLNMLDWALLIFAVISLLSTLFSDTKQFAFWGHGACKIGSFTILLLCLSCIFLSRNLSVDRFLLSVIILSGFVVFVWGITDCFDLDIMKWHVHLANPFDYISTIGNRNWYVGYIALLVPFVAILFLHEEDKKMKVLYGIYIFLGCISFYITKSTGSLLIFGCVIPLVYYALKKQEYFNGFLQLLWIFILASLTVKVMCYFVNPLHVIGDSIFATLQEHHWYVALIIAAVLLKILGKRILALHLEKIWLAFSALVILGMCLAVIPHFNGSFGTDRGYIWMYTIKTFSLSNPLQKLIGWGPDCFKNAVYSMAGNDIAATWPENNMVGNAHNEILQYLITTGIIGMISYLSIYILAFYNAIKKHSTLSIAAGTALFAYFCTTLSYNPQPLNYGILFVMLALVTHPDHS